MKIKTTRWAFTLLRTVGMTWRMALLLFLATILSAPAFAVTTTTVVHHSNQTIGGVEYRVHDVWVNADSSGWLNTDLEFDITSGLGIYHDANNTANSGYYEPTAGTVETHPDAAYDTFVTDHNGYSLSPPGNPNSIDLIHSSVGGGGFNMTSGTFDAVWAPFDAGPLFTGPGDFRIARIAITAGSIGTVNRGRTFQSDGGVVTETFLGTTITGDIIDGYIVTIPEPTTLALAALGLLSLGMTRRR